MPHAGKRALLSGGELVTAFVRRPHGARGFVRVESASGETAHIEALPSVLLRLGKEGGDVFEYKIEATAGSLSSFLVKFEGIDTPEAARALSGAEILVPREKACPLGEGEFYVSDLCRCALVCGNSVVGSIEDVMEGGGGFLLEVRLSGGELRLVPLKDAFIGAIDTEKKTVELLRRWILE